MSQTYVDNMDDHDLGLDPSFAPNLHHLGQQHHINFAMSDGDMLAGIQGNVNYSYGNGLGAKVTLSRWAKEGHDAPWHPPNLTNSTEDGGGPSAVSSMRDGPFIVPDQSNVVPLQPSDSGYVTATATYDNHGGSIGYDSSEANPDTQSIIGEHMGISVVDNRFPTMVDNIPGDAITLGGSWATPMSTEHSITICKECKKEMKTNSERRKHEHRHNKPYKCKVEDCPRRIKGFSSTNDLERHTRSLHPEGAISGNRYRCSIGSCESGNKIWPRADNFKAHLKRLHKRENLSNDDIAAYIYKPSISHHETRNDPQLEPMPEYEEYASSSNGQTDNWAHYPEVPSLGPLEPLTEEQDEDHLSLSDGQRGLAGLQDAHMVSPPEPYQTMRSSSPDPALPPSPMQHSTTPEDTVIDNDNPTSTPIQEQAAGVAEPYSAEVSVASEQAQHQQLESPDTCSDAIANTCSVLDTTEQLAHNDTGPAVPTETGKGASYQPSSSNLDLNNLDLEDITGVKRLIEVIRSRGILKTFCGLVEKCMQEKEIFEVVGSTETEARGTSQDRPHGCSACNKTFRRRCELKKHEKRHEKPFACTTTGCYKRFGSKNDWKRHENTQHVMSDIWRCDEESCGELHSHQEGFENHLKNAHKILDLVQLKERVERCHIATYHSQLRGGGIHQTAAEIKHKEPSDEAQNYGRGDVIPKNLGEWGQPDTLQNPKESPREDSDDAYSGCSSGGDAKTQHCSTREGADSVSGRSKSKRKRVDGTHVNNSKKGKLGIRAAAVCCECNDMITSSLVRCHYPCEHEPCSNCKRV